MIKGNYGVAIVIIEIENSLEGINSIFKRAEELISKFKDGVIEVVQCEEWKWTEYLRNADIINHTNVRIIGILEEKNEKWAGKKTCVDLMTENFPNLLK